MKGPYFKWAVRSSLYCDNWRVVRKIGQRQHGIEENKLGFGYTSCTMSKPSIRFVIKAKQELKEWQKNITFRDRLVLASHLKKHR